MPSSCKDIRMYATSTTTLGDRLIHFQELSLRAASNTQTVFSKTITSRAIASDRHSATLFPHNANSCRSLMPHVRRAGSTCANGSEATDLSVSVKSSRVMHPERAISYMPGNRPFRLSVQRMERKTRDNRHLRMMMTEHIWIAGWTIRQSILAGPLSSNSRLIAGRQFPPL